MKAFKKYLFLMQIILFMLFFVFSSDIFARRSGGSSGSRSFSSRRSSSSYSGSSYSGSSHSGSSYSGYSSSGSSNSSSGHIYDENDFLYDIMGVLFVFILFFFYKALEVKRHFYNFFNKIANKFDNVKWSNGIISWIWGGFLFSILLVPGIISMFLGAPDIRVIIKIHFKNGENKHLINAIVRYNDDRTIYRQPQKIMELILENKESIDFDTIYISEESKNLKALLKELEDKDASRVVEDSLSTATSLEKEELDVEEYTYITFVMRLSSEVTLSDDGSNIDLIKKILDLLNGDKIYLTEAFINQNVKK